MEDLQVADINAAMKKDDWDTRATLRAYFRRSMYLVTKMIVSYSLDGPNLMTDRTFKDRSDWIQNVVVNSKRGLLEDPRSLIKTTACTRTIPHWIAIQRPHPSYDKQGEFWRAQRFLDAHPHLRGVDNRILLAGDSEKNAAKFSGSVKAEYETNPFLRWLFPELVWRRGRHEGKDAWTDGEFFLPGRLNPAAPDPFLRAVGIDSKIVGGRADIVIYNDLIGDTNWRSPAERARRRDYIRTSSNLLENQDASSPFGGVLIIEGNRWCLDDVNSLVHDEFTHWDVWRRSIFRCFVHGYGNCGRRKSDEETTCAPTKDSLWPERYPDAEALGRLEVEKGPEIWAAQWLNDPTVVSELDANLIIPHVMEVETLTTADGLLRREWVVKYDDPATSKPAIIPLRALEHHCISVDVASSSEVGACRTAVVWCALDRVSGMRFVLECEADRWNPDAAVQSAFRLGLKVKERLGHWPKYLIEKVAAQTYFATALSNYARLQRTRLDAGIELLPVPRGIAKEDRNRRAIGNVLHQQRLSIRAGLQLPRTEIRHAPSGSSDTLDAMTQWLTYAQEVVRGTNEDSQREARRRAKARRLAAADITGVSI